MKDFFSCKKFSPCCHNLHLSKSQFEGATRTWRPRKLKKISKNF